MTYNAGSRHPKIAKFMLKIYQKKLLLYNSTDSTNVGDLLTVLRVDWVVRVWRWYLILAVQKNGSFFFSLSKEKQKQTEKKNYQIERRVSPRPLTSSFCAIRDNNKLQARLIILREK